jgi:hypothetical protein
MAQDRPWYETYKGTGAKKAKTGTPDPNAAMRLLIGKKKPLRVDEGNWDPFMGAGERSEGEKAVDAKLVNKDLGLGQELWEGSDGKRYVRDTKSGQMRPYNQDFISQVFRNMGLGDDVIGSVPVTDPAAPVEEKKKTTVPPGGGGGGCGETDPATSTRKLPLQLAMWMDEDKPMSSTKMTGSWKDSMRGGIGGLGTGLADALVGGIDRAGQKNKRSAFLNKYFSEGGKPVDFENFSYQHTTTPEEQQSAMRQALVDRLTAAKISELGSEEYLQNQRAKFLPDEIAARASGNQNLDVMLKKLSEMAGK